MSLSRKSPRQQPDSVPQGNQSHGTGADPQPATPAPTPALAVPRCPRGWRFPRPSICSSRISPEATRAILALAPANDADPGAAPARPDRPLFCPHCGHRHGGYEQQASDVLDWLVSAIRPLSEARRLVEAEVL